MSIHPTRSLTSRRASAGRLSRRHPRSVVPELTAGEHSFRRFHHHDVAELTSLEIFAERAILTAALSDHVYRRRRDRLVPGAACTQRTWMVDRLAKLQAEEQRRHAQRVVS